MELQLKMRAISLLILFSGTGFLFSQGIKEEFIMKDTLADTALYRKYNVCFDRAGNYCITYKSNGKHYFLTRERRYGPFDHYRSDNREGSEYVHSGKNYDNLHYKSVSGVHVYGPQQELLIDFAGSEDGKTVAATFGPGHNDSALLYINNKQVGRVRNYYLHELVRVNKKGDLLYRIENGPGKGIYYNGTRVDSLDIEYVNEMELNEQGGYYYHKGADPGGVFIHSSTGKDTVFQFGEAGFTGDGKYYVLDEFLGRIYFEGGKEFRFGRGVHFEMGGYRTQDDFFQEYRGQGTRYDSMLVNGRPYCIPYPRSPYYLSFNKAGELSYALRDYGNFFRWKGGIRLLRYGRTPDTKNNTRYHDFNVIYMSPGGDSVLYYYTAAHTTFVKMNDQLLFIVAEADFAHYPQAHFFEESRGGYRDNYDRIAPVLSYIELDSAGYFIYKGKFSPPCQPIYKTKHSRKAINYHREHLRRWGSSLVSSSYGLEGFYFIQERSDGAYWVNINNKHYYTLDNMDVIYSNNVYFDGKELIFYALKNGSYYRYTIKPD